MPPGQGHPQLPREVAQSATTERESWKSRREIIIPQIRCENPGSKFSKFGDTVSGSQSFDDLREKIVGGAMKGH